MKEPFSDIRWLGKNKSGNLWQVECSCNDLDVNDVVVRMSESKQPLPRAKERDPLLVLTPADTRGGNFVIEHKNNNHLLFARQIPLDGSANCRDMGGYPVENNKRVAWRKLFRSGHWSELSVEDLSYINDLNISLICDFRSEEEQQNQPPKLPKESTTTFASLSITPGSVKGYFQEYLQRSQAGKTVDGCKMMRQINRELALNHIDKYRDMFKLILEHDEGAIVINCTAGKDRTGFGAALILFALGASEEVVVSDYLKTQNYAADRAKKIIDHYVEKYDLKRETISPMLSVREEYIRSAFDAVRQEHGNISEYLHHLGVDDRARDELRGRFLS